MGKRTPMGYDIQKALKQERIRKKRQQAAKQRAAEHALNMEIAEALLGMRNAGYPGRVGEWAHERAERHDMHMNRQNMYYTS